MHMLGERIVDRFAFKYCSDLLNCLKLYRSKHMYELAHLDYACTIFGRYMKRLTTGKKTVLIASGKNEPFIGT